MQRTLKAIAFTTLSTVGLLPILASVTSQSAFAQTQSTVQVRALVNAKCTITSTDVDFGTYDPLAPTVTKAEGSVTIACTPGAIAKVGLDQGSNNRTMKNTDPTLTTPLSYELYKPLDTTPNTSPGKGSVWGNTDPNTLILPKALNITPREYKIYGELAPLQNVDPGSYLDNVTATVNL